MPSKDTQLKEALNNAITCMCPKFKHFGSTMTLTTRVNIVINIINTSFNTLYTRLLPLLWMLAEDGQYTHLKHVLKRIDQMKKTHVLEIASATYKLTCKYKDKVKKRTSSWKANKPTDAYRSGIGFVSDDRGSNFEPSKREKGKSFYNWCDKLTNHVTWWSKNCDLHNAYKNYIQEERGKKGLLCKDTKHTNPPI